MKTIQQACLALAVVVLALAAWPHARAQGVSEADWNACYQGTDAAAGVRGCGNIIQNNAGDDEVLVGAYSERGEHRIGLRDFAGALQDLNQSIQMGSPYAETYFLRGLANAYLGNFREAIADWEETLRRNPDAQATATIMPNSDGIREYIQIARDGLAEQQAGGASDSADSGNIQSCTVDFDNAYTAFESGNPLRPNWGTRSTFQYAYFLGTRGLGILEEHRACMADADYQGRRQQLIGMRDSGRDGCNQTSTTPGSCAPDYPIQ